MEDRRPAYLYHGSQYFFDRVKPHRASGECEAESRMAIYAAETIREVIPFALPIRWYPDDPIGKREFRCNDGKTELIYGSLDPDGVGYVYKMRSEGFVKIDSWQWISDRETVPEEIIRINVRDYWKTVVFSKEARRIQSLMYGDRLPALGSSDVWHGKNKEESMEEGKLIYQNALSCERDIQGFCLEGSAKLTFPEGRLRMENALDAGEGQKANYVLWCPEDFPSDVRIEWKFRPLNEPGLAILFFSAKGRGGEELFAPGLEKRTGEYAQYHHGDINAFHVSYFRRKEPDERALHTCNLRKSYGFHLVAQGGDPIPDADECRGMYRIAVEKKGERVRFLVEDVEVFRFVDDGVAYGPLLSGGKIGFRQLAPMAAEYADLRVYELTESSRP